jgi:hypothetical protein
MTPINIPISARSLVNLTNSNIGLLAKLTLKIFVQVQARSARSNQFQNSQVNQVTKKADKRLFLKYINYIFGVLCIHFVIIDHPTM